MLPMIEAHDALGLRGVGFMMVLAALECFLRAVWKNT